MPTTCPPSEDRVKTSLILACLCISSVVPLAAQDQARAPTGALQKALSHADTVTQTITPATIHHWRLSVASGRYAVVEVVQHSIDVIVRVIAPDGGERTFVDRTDVPESEIATWITDVAGTWTVAVTPFAEDGDAGSYAIAWLVSRDATERDRWSVEADSLSNRALLLEDEGMPAEAERLHRQALVIYESLHGTHSVELLAPLSDLGRVLEQQGRLADAEPVYRTFLEITSRARGPGHPDAGRAAMELARLFIDAARYPEAQAMIEEALNVFTAAFGSQHRDVAGVLSDLGRVHGRQGNYELAEFNYLKALAVLDSILAEDDPQPAITLNNLAVLYVAQARYQEASEAYRRANAINTAAYGPEHLQVAIGQNNLAGLLKIWGRFDEAEPLYRRSLATHLAIYGPNHRAVGNVLSGLAGLLELRGNHAEAEQLYRRTVDVFTSVLPPGHPDIAGALVGLGHVYRRQGRTSLAEANYRQALEVYQTSLGERHPVVATTLNSLAGLYVELGDHAAADTLLERAQLIEESTNGPEHPNVALELRIRAHSYHAQGRYAEAVPLWSRALAILEAALGPAHSSVAYTLRGWAQAQFMAGLISADSALALLDRAIAIYEATPDASLSVAAYVARASLRERRGDHRGAVEDLEEALLSVEEQRAQVGGDEETRARFFEDFAPLFAQMVSWQLAAGDPVSAFAWAERGRARVLLDQLAAGKIDLRSSIPRETRVLLERRETDAQSRLAEFQQRITLLRSRTDLSEADRRDRIGVLEDSLRLADEEYRQVYADIKNASPLWRDEITSGGQPSSLRDIQRTVVPGDGLMLSYQIGPERSFVFVVAPRGRELEAVALEITEAAAAALDVESGPLTQSVLRTIIAGDSTGARADRAGLFQDLAASARGSKVAGRSRVQDPETRLHALWQVLVPAAIRAEVMATTELVVIPDGPLHYLPFEALVMDTAHTPDGVTYWLDAGPPIRYAASATVLNNVSRRPAARVAQSTAGPMMLSISDPIFDPGEVVNALQAAGNITAARRDTTTGAAITPTRDSYERSGGSLARLPGTARETDAVRTTFGARAATSLQVLSGIEATESNLRAALAGKRFLHLATHGLVDQRRGTLFASLALTPPTGETTDHENDGFWQLHEIYANQLPDVELAVLSACESNIGETVEGEGVFALSRGFSAAGAQRVVASQWSVDDASTAELIGEFFRRVLAEESQGRQVNYAAALRDAKRAVRSQEQWRDPYFWAPFVLTGRQ